MLLEANPYKNRMARAAMTYNFSFSIMFINEKSIKEIPIKNTPNAIIGLRPYFIISFPMRGEQITTATE